MDILRNVSMYILTGLTYIVGIVTLGWGLWDIGSGLWGSNKELKKVLIGIGIGALGAIILGWGAPACLAFFKTAGQNIPLR
ncbi:hypothetical protein HCB27_16635 [Listeria booriae]|uniref:Uncharacterized protein n=1 Tax=Listeria booriae TaxID=1552123 RepID=A0A7X0Z945_9LIST|nr:hypothetical protein [Listeria booriae]MBC2178216.1 hypothetical protein [Listeria booriae]MBC2178257.1 hypothetical protein [Listeria booriae]MBC2292980.1 hypothetical protein [Listeria booriae]